MMIPTIISAPILLQSAGAFMIYWPDAVQEKETKAPITTSEEDNIYVVWWSNRTGNWEVIFRASNDSGQTFGERINLSNSTANSAPAAIAAADNHVYVAWWEQDPQIGIARVLFTVSDDNGQTFGDVVDINNATYPNIEEILATYEAMGNASRSSAEILLAAEGDSIYGVATAQSSLEQPETEVFIRVSHDNGQTFSPKVNLSESPSVVSNNTELAVVGENVYVSWWERANATSNEPVMRVSNDGGETFGPILRLPANGTIGSTTATTDETGA